jgi:DNA integrity scanning protein DisA with diadenylate cyclase activity
MTNPTISLIALTASELQQMLDSAAQLAVEKYLKSSQQKPGDPSAAEEIFQFDKNNFLDTSEVAKLLKVRRQTVCVWAKRGLLQRYHISRRAYFKRDEVLASPLADPHATGRRKTAQKR